MERVSEEAVVGDNMKTVSHPVTRLSRLLHPFRNLVFALHLPAEIVIMQGIPDLCLTAKRTDPNHEAEQTELSSPPFDSISSVRFSPFNSVHLLVSSWDAVSSPCHEAHLASN